MAAERQIKDMSVSFCGTESDSQSNDSLDFMKIQVMSLDEINKLLSSIPNDIQPLTYQIRQPIENLSSVTMREL